MTVAIVGDADACSEHDLVRQAVEAADGDVVTVNIGEWPDDAPTEYTVGERACDIGTEIRFDEVTGVFSIPWTVFEPSAPNLREQYDGADINSVYRRLSEWKGLFQSLVSVFESYGARVVVSPTVSYWNSIGPRMWDLYDRNGIPVPDSIVTNEAERVREFISTHGSAVIVPVNGRNEPERLDTSDPDPERLERLTTTPVFVRETVSGVDIRGYVLDGTLVGACQYDRDPKSPVVPGRWSKPPAAATEATLERQIREALLTAAALTPATFTAADLRVQADGTFVLLGAVTPGRFAVPDSAGVTDVSGALAEYLMADNRTDE